MLFEDMNPIIYIGATTFIYLASVAGGLFITDLGKVFEIIAGLSLSFLDFIWPGIFYIFAERKYSKKKSLINITHAWF